MPEDVRTRVSDPLELESSMVVGAVWVLGMEPRSSARGVSSLKRQATSPAAGSGTLILPEQVWRHEKIQVWLKY